MDIPPASYEMKWRSSPAGGDELRVVVGDAEEDSISGLPVIRIRSAKAFRIGAESRLRRALSPICAI